MFPIKNEVDYLNNLYRNEIVWKRDRFGTVKTTNMVKTLNGEERPLGSIIARRSYHDQEGLVIELNGELKNMWQRNHHSTPILFEGQIDKQVGAIKKIDEERGLMIFSRSAEGQTAKRLLASGKLQSFVATKDFGKGSQPCAVSIRYKDKSDTEQTESEVNMSDNEKILELASKYNQPDLAVKSIQAGQTLDQFRGELLSKIEKKELSTPSIISSEQRSYNISNLIRAEISNDWSSAGYEREISQELKRNSQINPKGHLVPMNDFYSRATMVSSGDVSGALGTDLRPSLYIDIPRQASSVMQAGATVITGLTQKIAMPKNNSDVSANFFNENSAITEDDIDIDTITLNPTLCAGTSSFSREVLVTSTPQIDQLVREGLEKQIMNRIDASALEGDGSAPNPTGIANVSGINTKVTAGSSTMTHAESLEVIASVAANNLDASGGAFIIHPNDAATIGATSKDTGSGTFVYENGLIGGKRVIESTHATEGTCYFGVFKHVYIGMFGNLDLVIDPYSGARSGIVHITASQLVDIQVGYNKAFNKITLTA